MQFSYSSLETYENCPLKYKFRYVEKAPAQAMPAPERELGKNLHRALKEFYEHLDQMAPSADLLVQLYTAFWESKGFATREEEQFVFRQGIKILEGFYAANQGHFTRPLATEKFFLLPFGEHTLTGLIDRIDQHPDGTLEVIDYKTSKKIGTQQTLEKNDQVAIYSLAVEHLFGKKPQHLTLYYLRSNFVLSKERDDAQIERTKEKAGITIGNILEKKFDPKYGPLCDYCEYQYICFGHKDKFRKKDQVDDLTGVNIDQVVAEFQRLKEEKGGLDDKIDGLKEVILRYFETHQVDRIYTEDLVVSRRKTPRFVYETAKVKELLGPLGLFDEVVEVKAKKVDALAEGGKISPQVFDDLEKAKNQKGETVVVSVSQIKKPPVI